MLYEFHKSMKSNIKRNRMDIISNDQSEMASQRNVSQKKIESSRIQNIQSF